MRADPQVLQAPKATNKETHPGKMAMAAESRTHGRHSFLGKTREGLIFEYKCHNRAIKKHKKWK